MRMPRLTRRFSLERMFSVFLATIGRSRATQRSRARRGTAQELFAFLAVYQALCALRAEAASTAGTDPDQVSFTVTLRVQGYFKIAVRSLSITLGSHASGSSVCAIGHRR